MQNYKAVVLTKLKKQRGQELTNEHKTLSREAMESLDRFNIPYETEEYVSINDATALFNSLNFMHFPNMFDVHARDPEAVARFLSHWKVWTKCVTENIPYLIVDYNGYMIAPLPGNVTDLYEHALHLSIKADHERNLVRVFAPDVIFNKDGSYTNSAGRRIPILEYSDMKRNFIPNLTAYMIKPKGVVRLAKFVQQEGALPMDVMINGSIVNLKYFTMPVFSKNTL